MVQSSNVAGHRARYDAMKEMLTPEELGVRYVGGGNVDQVGDDQVALLHKMGPLEGAAVVDIGCGIGRLARKLVAEPIGSYLGVDIIDEVLQEARASVKDDTRFRFEIATDFVMPAADGSADMACGHSIFTHLLDEEIYYYLRETARLLRPGGRAVFSFVDLRAAKARFDAPNFRKMKIRGQFIDRPDLYRCCLPEMMELFANWVGFDVVGYVAPNAKRSQTLIFLTKPSP